MTCDTLFYHGDTHTVTMEDYVCSDIALKNYCSDHGKGPVGKINALIKSNT